MNIFIPKTQEDWIIDRIRNEWYAFNSNCSTKFIFNSNIIWILAPWNWKKVPKRLLKKKKVLCTYHHLDLNSNVDNTFKNFKELDYYVDEYHSISKKTTEDLKKLTNKRINNIPIWINPKIWFYISEKERLREKYKFEKKDFLIGSFQRDTEGVDLTSPKLIKGPDIFVEIIKDLIKKNKNIKIVLTGKRRQYIIGELKKYKIPYVYFEMVDISELNELYNILDLYIVSSRIEGGPQAIVECGITKTPIISTDVGIAPEILSKKSIYQHIDKNYLLSEPDVNTAYNNSKKLLIDNINQEYLRMFKELL